MIAECPRHGLVQAAKPATPFAELVGHLLISVFTCGAWLPFAGLALWARARGAARCPVCGSRLERAA